MVGQRLPVSGAMSGESRPVKSGKWLNSASVNIGICFAISNRQRLMR